MGHNKWIQKASTQLKNMKLQSKFMAGYLIACAFPLLVVSSIIYSQSAAGLEDSSQEFAALYTSQIENSLNELMKEYDKVTKSILVDNDLISKLGEEHNMSTNEYIVQKFTVQRALMRVALLKSEMNNVMLISRDNSVYQYTNTSSTVNESALLTQEWYKKARSTGDTLFITGLHDRSYYEDKGQGALVTVGRVLLSSEGAFAGVLLIDLDPFTLMELNHEFVLTRDKYGMSVIISKASGETVYHSDAASGRVPWMQVLEAGNDYTKDVSSSDRIVISGSTQLGNLVIKTEIPREKLLQKINRIKLVTIILIILGFVLTALISFALSLRITKPIKALRRSMKHAETGQYLPIESIQANDEIGSLVHSYNKMIVVIRTLIEDVYIAEIKQRKAKFLALQNQINPHMLYNTLESIRMKALVKEEEEIAGMIKILARMFRLTLGKDGKQHSIKHEIDYTVNYLQLQNIRFADSFQLDVRMPEEMQQCSIIPLVFQPIVENSIIHGFQGYEGSMHIVIEGTWTADGGIWIRIIDDGIGMSREKQDELSAILEDAVSDKYKLEETDNAEGGGLGLKNIAERITLHYGDMYKLTVRSGDDQGTTVEILIPKY
ncbi:two-component sensor histidine kinase [Paenibacillus pectinilyticus]|uniref:histidine kinase n=1 Tax=Paenibacillus pectinilyticus TaxID=512399 RepID=A0A1C0ZXT3_9BACL|nr:sensor histidine kinase [Paenibacillus pectinilyticus]OCT12830.1 two-component sensor histidine kinase [Paenibacillus pectinilyticus]